MSIGYLPGAHALTAMGRRQSTLTHILNELVKCLSQAPVSLGLDRKK
jgi:hypothetical protein